MLFIESFFCLIHESTDAGCCEVYQTKLITMSSVIEAYAA